MWGLAIGYGLTKLTPWSRVLEKIRRLRLITKFLGLYKIWSYMTEITRNRHPRQEQSSPCPQIPLKIWLSSHLLGYKYRRLPRSTGNIVSLSEHRVKSSIWNIVILQHGGGELGVTNVHPMNDYKLQIYYCCLIWKRYFYFNLLFGHYFERKGLFECFAEHAHHWLMFRICWVRLRSVSSCRQKRRKVNSLTTVLNYWEGMSVALKHNLT